MFCFYLVTKVYGKVSHLLALPLSLVEGLIKPSEEESVVSAEVGISRLTDGPLEQIPHP